MECDGHEFHERTPEQASKDRWRDRMIKRMGVGRSSTFYLQAAQEARQLLERQELHRAVWGRGYVLRDPVETEAKIPA